MKRFFITSDGYIFVELEDGTLTNGDMSWICVQDAMDDEFVDIKEISSKDFSWKLDEIYTKEIEGLIKDGVPVEELLIHKDGLSNFLNQESFAFAEYLRSIDLA